MNTKSLWQATAKFADKESLSGHIQTPVAIIGGGMTGLLCAYLLKEKGIDSIVLEAEKTAHGVTAYTTGKITPQHALIYDTLIQNAGEEKARNYLYANIEAVQKFKEIILKNNIDCDYEELPNIVYTLRNPEKIKREVEAANRLGFPSELVSSSTLPFPILAGIRNHYSAMFHPLKFLQQIAEGLTIYEHTKISKIRGNTLITNNGIITADKIIVATHYPIKDVPGFYFARLVQERTYLMAIKCKKKLDGMYLDEAEDGMTFRNYQNYIILGGMAHKTGFTDQNAFEKLEQKAEELYPGCPVEFLWSAQDCTPLDEMPYIGRYSMFTPNLYVATGYHKWGMTGAMVSAMIISDQIANRSNPYESVFTPQRLNLKVSAKPLLRNVKNFLISRKKEIFDTSDVLLSDIKPGEGKIVEVNNEKRGVYCDENGKYHMVNAKCSHLGCLLTWNPAEKSWDCPCHGSRFDIDGSVISNPACDPI